MSDDINRIKAELEALGYETSCFDGPYGKVVSFDYTIETGFHKGQQVAVGVSFQETGYPDYPPHWIHVKPPIDDGKGGSTLIYPDASGDGQKWLAMSRPPGDIWDQLPTKHMGTYISEHLRRIWKDV